MTALLELQAVDNGYGNSQVLFGMSLSIQAGQCVSIQGRNGMGKTTTIKSIMGMQRAWRGQILWQGQAIHHAASHTIAQLGLGLVPEGRQIFPNLSVRENLIATAIVRKGMSQPWSYDRIISLFPRLAERAKNFGNQLSGGEQQMLAIGRALMTNPKLLILDEATEGLSPLVRQEIWLALRTVRSEGMSILIIDKNLSTLLDLCDYHHIVEKGTVVWHGISDTLRISQELREKYLGA